jgi:hypothetical protein
MLTSVCHLHVCTSQGMLASVDGPEMPLFGCIACVSQCRSFWLCSPHPRCFLAIITMITIVPRTTLTITTLIISSIINFIINFILNKVHRCFGCMLQFYHYRVHQVEQRGYTIQGPTALVFPTMAALLTFYSTNTAGNIVFVVRQPVLPRVPIYVA